MSGSHLIAEEVLLVNFLAKETQKPGTGGVLRRVPTRRRILPRSANITGRWLGCVDIIRRASGEQEKNKNQVVFNFSVVSDPLG
jgi:hypothetical protein